MAKANPLKRRFLRTGMPLSEIKQQVVARGTLVTIGDLRACWSASETVPKNKYDAIMDTLNEIEHGNIVDVTPDIKKAATPQGGMASITEHMSATNIEIANAAQAALYWMDRPRVKSDEECAARLAEFWQYTAQTGSYPTVEKMALALGVDRNTLNTWKNGELGTSKRRVEMVRKSFGIMASMCQELASTGKINVVAWIFTAKNFFDMSDKQELVVSPNTPLTNVQSEEELRKKYAGAIANLSDEK